MNIKQDKRKDTLIEYMGLKDPDLFLPDHDKWCLKLLNKKLLRRIFKTTSGLKIGNLFGLKVYVHEIKNEIDKVRLFDVYEPGWHFYLVDEYEKTYFIQNEIIELEHVLTKHGSNGFSQRLGFIDVYFKIILRPNFKFKINEKEYELEGSDERFSLFIEVKTKKQTVGMVTREIEYYRDVLNEIDGGRIIPVVVSPEKIPINQFISLNFEEILQLEKESEKDKE